MFSVSTTTPESFELHELRRARKKIPFRLPDSAVSVLGDIPEPNGSVTFRLRRVKEGAEIWLSTPMNHGVFSWSVSHVEKVWPADFDAAREWVAAYAARHGQILEEEIKPRMKRPIGDDRKLWKAGGCREAWLASDIPDLYAAAAVRCQHMGGFCMYDGYCHFGNCDMEMTPEPTDHGG